MILSTLSLLGLLPLACLAQPSSTFWYGMNGEHMTVYHQKDVFAFRLLGGQEFQNPFPPSIVRQVVTRVHDPDHLTVLEFADGVDDAMMQMVKDQVMLEPGYECAFHVVNLAPGKPNTEHGWSPVDDQILVTFRDPYYSATEIASFCARHRLTLTRPPLAGLVPGYSHCHVFTVASPFHCEDGYRAIDVCRLIWEADSVDVMIVEPNLVMAFEPETNDPKYALQWYIENTGQSPLAENNPGGTYDADHDINP